MVSKTARQPHLMAKIAKLYYKKLTCCNIYHFTFFTCSGDTIDTEMWPFFNRSVNLDGDESFQATIIYVNTLLKVSTKFWFINTVFTYALYIPTLQCLQHILTK